MLNGICSSGYSPLSNETECKTLAGHTISDIGPLRFYQTNCEDSWTPEQSCFADISNNLFFVDEDCGQNPQFQTNRLVCKKHGNNFHTF